MTLKLIWREYREVKLSDERKLRQRPEQRS